MLHSKNERGKGKTGNHDVHGVHLKKESWQWNWSHIIGIKWEHETWNWSFQKLGGGTSHIKGQIEKIRFEIEISKTWAICMKAVPVRSRVTYLAKLGGLRGAEGRTLHTFTFLTSATFLLFPLVILCFLIFSKISHAHYCSIWNDAWYQQVFNFCSFYKSIFVSWKTSHNAKQVAIPPWARIYPTCPTKPQTFEWVLIFCRFPLQVSSR